MNGLSIFITRLQCNTLPRSFQGDEGSRVKSVDCGRLKKALELATMIFIIGTNLYGLLPWMKDSSTTSQRNNEVFLCTHIEGMFFARFLPHIHMIS